ncbi:MAG: tRNA uridine-5-carboxymethylaminomethyl(34) synthesis GTPase MnmE [Bacteroidia bacterium]|nr:tRNA uridine-5-carboxymethylaminomethyl(34) synthesis GTPase MnmE [Bacteroidia bacterium]
MSQEMGIYVNDTICAVSTASGMGAIAIIRISGERSHEITLSVFRKKTGALNISDIKAYKAYFGEIFDPKSEDMIDEVLVTFFKNPHSYTGEDSVEISCHGSVYVQQRILELLVNQGGRLAEPGEFSKRAFINGKLDLTQAEAVADLISSQNEASHRIAVNQLKGGFSKELKELRAKLLDLTSLLELELDFSEEDVEFADRTQLRDILNESLTHIGKLTDSFRLGNAIKNGIPVAIVGETNAGKSTLLNAILGEERAIVSDIEGTTRDTIEETFNIDGTLYRFIDTAGIRETSETIEKIGIERTFRKISEADIILGMLDLTKGYENVCKAAELIISKIDSEKQTLLLIGNKRDLAVSFPISQLQESYQNIPFSFIYAKDTADIDTLKSLIIKYSNIHKVTSNESLVTNVRHYEALVHAAQSLRQVRNGMDMNLSADLLAEDLKDALYHLGSITGEVTNNEVLGNIFKRFCVGK